MFLKEKEVQLGVGLIGIGRLWGYKETPVPSEQDALDYLREAYKYGISFFDTAPSYGLSESRLGLFLNKLSSDERRHLVVATKVGEHWNAQLQTAYTDHTLDALKTSIDQSVSRLGKIDLLQVHKTTPDILRSDELFEALDYARSQGIAQIGASISDIESGLIVCNSDLFDAIQLPFNTTNDTFKPVIERALSNKKLVIINRPLNMGGVIYADSISSEHMQVITNSYSFIVEALQVGIVLTGTKSPLHLRENIEAFKQAIHTKILK